MVRELCKYDTIEHLTLVEIDQQVIETAKQFFPGIATSFDDVRLDLCIQDGTEFAQSYTGKPFDIILVDSNDPIGPGKGLFNKRFYKDMYRILADPGILVTQSQSPRFNENVFSDLFRIYKELFGVNQSRCYLVHMPSYPTGMWSFSYLSKGTKRIIDPVLDINEDRLKYLMEHQPLQYYNKEIHKASFALPNYVKQMI